MEDIFFSIDHVVLFHPGLSALKPSVEYRVIGPEGRSSADGEEAEETVEGNRA